MKTPHKHNLMISDDNRFALRAPKLRFVVNDGGVSYGKKPSMDTPEKINQFYRETISADVNFESGKEHVVVLLLSSRLELIGYNIVSVGTVSEASAHPREVLRPVLMAGAYGFCLLHNHPSGDPSPSRADEMITRRMVEAAQTMQLKFLDHVICGVPSPGRSAYYSFREAGLIA